MLNRHLFKNTQLSSRLRLPGFIFQRLDLITSLCLPQQKASCDQISAPHVHIYRLWSTHLLIFCLLDKQRELLMSITIRHVFQTFHHSHGFFLWTLSNSRSILLQSWKSALRTAFRSGAQDRCILPLPIYLSQDQLFGGQSPPAAPAQLTPKPPGPAFLVDSMDASTQHLHLERWGSSEVRCSILSPTPLTIHGCRSPTRVWFVGTGFLLGESSWETPSQHTPCASQMMLQALESELKTDDQWGPK